MLPLLVLSLLAHLTWAGVPRYDHFETTAWSDWGACRSPFNRHVTDRASFPSSPASPDVGAMRRVLNMKRKTLERLRVQTCREAGTCPWLTNREMFKKQDCVDGMAGVFPCLNIDVSAFLDIEELGYDRPVDGESISLAQMNDIWGWTDQEEDEDYVIAGINGGSSFVRVTDPHNPVVLGFLPSETSASIWRDMKVVGHYIYIVSEARDHGLQIFDLHRLRDMEASTDWLEHDGHYNRFGNAHNIVSNPETGFLFVVGATQSEFPDSCQGGLHMIDANDPGNPVYAGCFDQDGYTHDAQCLIYHGPDVDFQGHEICFGYNEDTFTIIDVTDKSNPEMVSRTGYDGYDYTHQGWVTEDHTVILLDDEGDEIRAEEGDKHTRTYIWDIISLREPVMKSIYYSSVESIDHNQYILGDYTYQSNYMAGLRVLEIDQQEFDLYEKAYFMLEPHESPTAFDGSWSNYPYFPMRNGEHHVPTTSVDLGLFIFKINHDDFDAAKTHTGLKYRSREVINVTQRSKWLDLDQYKQCT